MAENGPIDIEGKQLQKTVDETENYKIHYCPRWEIDFLLKILNYMY